MFTNRLAIVVSMVLAVLCPSAFGQGLRLPYGTAKITAETNGAASNQAYAVDVLDYYKAIPGEGYSNVWGIFIGINKYANYSSLQNSVSDASELASVFHDVCGMRQPKVLTNQQASLEGIKQALREIGTNSGPADLFVFHFSGHGIGFQYTNGMRTGLLLLHDAPANLGTSSSGTLNMELVQRLIEESGIQAKHQLYLLDSCYSGMGVRSRSAFGSSATLRTGNSPEARSDNLKSMMQKQAIYLMTAGGAGQPVLDGATENGTGHGLLSGFVIEALRNPKLYELQETEYQGQSYLSARELFNEASVAIYSRAQNTLSTAFDSWRVAHAPPALAKRDGDPLKSIFERCTTTNELLKLVQNPQDDQLKGEGRVYLPVNKTESTVLPVQSQPATTLSFSTLNYADWAKKVGLKYQSAEYGESLQALFQILEHGVPSGVANPVKLALTAELMRRPIITAKEVLRFFPDYIVREKYPQLQTNKAALNLARLWELERYRQNTVGAGWKPMVHQGDVISPNYEYRFEVNNRCETPLYYYLIAHDGAGIVQWISPKNSTAGPENPKSPFTFGQSPLAVGTKPLTLPENREFEGHAITYGWPAEGAADQQFFLVVTPAPWKELEAALTKASTLGFQLYKTALSQGQALTPVSGAIPSLKLGLRAVGASEQLLDLDEATPTVAEAPGIITRTDGHLLVYSWHVKMVSAEQMHPENRLGQ